MSAGNPEPPQLDLRRVLVVSPHFDDAVLSCAHLLSAADSGCVVTVFGGVPDRYPAPINEWDRRCGFAPGDDIITLRRAEDASALEVLGVTGITLDFVDRPYRYDKKYDIEALKRELRCAIDSFGATAVVAPLAIQHPDHKASLAATLQLRDADDGREWGIYAEFPYVWREPDATARRVAEMRRGRYRMTAMLDGVRAPDIKAKAMRAYRSQIIGLDLADDVDRVADASEQVWRLGDRSPILVRAVRWAGYRTRILK
jgi:LmbE family N-acetylglucosaminyl deacetylase